MKILLITFTLVLMSACSETAKQSPYAGEELNSIKSLSPDEVNSLLQGDGMGFAKAAELNHYPGPLHVLELAGKLKLSDKQITQTNQIFKVMNQQATQLGAELIEHEKTLDSLFASGKITAWAMDSLLLKIGETKAKLRGVHLHAHLEMKQVLSQQQIMLYDDLRGYSSGHHHHSHQH